MSDPKNLTIEEMHEQLEDLIYRYNAIGSENNSSINFIAKEELTEEEKTRLTEYRENLGDLDEEETIDFYTIQNKAQIKASIDVGLGSHDSKPPSVSIGFGPQFGNKFSSIGKEKPNKELFKNLIGLGWKIGNQDFEYTTSQQEILNGNKKVAELTISTIQLFDMYSWEVFTQEDNE